MTFSQPWFLFGLIALAVPIIVHLFNFRKPKTVYFTKVRLLRQSVIEVNKTQKIKHYLVLLSRLLFLLFLVLAFSQPVFENANKAKSGVIGIYIDNSQSMLATSKSGDVLTSSINMVEALANNLSNNTKFVFLDNDFSSKDLNIINREQLKDRLTEISVSPKTRNIAQAQKKLHANIEKLGFGKDASLYLVSDFQKSVNKTASQVLNEPTHLINLSTKGKINIFVDTVYLENPYVMPEENTVLKVVVSCSGDETMDNVPIRLLVDDIASGTANIKLAPGQATNLEFNVKIKADKASLCKIQVDDSPVVFDNEYFFVLQPIKPIQISVLSNNPNSPYAKVFDKDPSFVLNQYSFSAINYGKLKQTQLLVIDGLENADNVLFEYASEILKRNGTVVFNLGKNYNKGNVQEQVAKLTGQNLSIVKDTTQIGFETIQMPDMSNPFFKNIYKSTKDNIQLPKSKIVLNSKAMAIYTTQQGNQALSKYPLKSGSLFSINTLLESTYSDLHTHPFFVTFMLKAALSSNNAEEALSYTVNTNTLKLANTGSTGDNNFKITAKDVEIIPTVFNQNNESILDLSNTNLKTGFYEIHQNNTLLKTIALNYDKVESQLESYSNEELKNQFAGNKAIKVLEADGVHDTVKEIKSEFDSNFLWKYCLMIALAFLAIEVLLIRFLK